MRVKVTMVPNPHNIGERGSGTTVFWGGQGVVLGEGINEQNVERQYLRASDEDRSGAAGAEAGASRDGTVCRVAKPSPGWAGMLPGSRGVNDRSVDR